MWASDRITVKKILLLLALAFVPALPAAINITNKALWIALVIGRF